MKYIKALLITPLLLSVLTLASLSGTSVRTAHNGDDSTVAFAFTFPVIQSSDLVIIKRTTATGAEVVQTETTHYSVSAVNNDYSSGGTVTFVTAPASTETVLIIRDISETQETTLSDSGVLRLESIEDALDKITMTAQQHTEEFNRCLKFPRTDSTSLSSEIDDSVDRASTYMIFDSSGNIGTTSAITGYTGSVTTFVETILDDESAAEVRTTLGSTIGTDVQAYDAELAALAGLTSAADKVPYFTGSETASVADLSAYGRTLIDDAAASNARTTLELGTVSLLASDTDGALAADSDSVVATQKATKTYVDAGIDAIACRMWPNNVQENLTTATDTLVLFDGESYDTDGIGDLLNEKITPTSTGYYLIHGSVSFDGVDMVADKRFHVSIKKNGTSIATSTSHSAETVQLSVEATAIVHLDGNDYIQLYAKQSTGANLIDLQAGVSSTFLELIKIGN